MHQPTRVALALSLLLVAATAAGCQVSGNVLDSSSDAGAPLNGACVPGASVACVGPLGCAGYQVCNSAGSALEACECGIGGEASISRGASDATATEASDSNALDADSDSSLRDAPASDGPAVDGQQEGGPMGGGLTDTSMDGESTSVDASIDGSANCIPAADAAADAGMCGGGMCGTIVLFGGAGPVGPGAPFLTDTWTFDGTSWIEVLPTSAPPPRESTAMATLGNEVVLFGGEAQSGFLNDTWTFDGTTWTQVSSLAPPAVASAAMATLGNLVVQFGGAGEGAIEPVTDTWTFDGSSWTKSATNLMPGLIGPSMATLGNELVLFGGLFEADEGTFCPPATEPLSSCTLNDTWTFSVNAPPPGPGALAVDWNQLSVSNPPPARSGAAMATLGNEVVLFGGNSGQGITSVNDLLSDTWTFDGSSWTQVPVSSAPSPRADAMMATLGNEVVLFGGMGVNDSALNDTWVFDGTNWTQFCASNPPPGRGGGAMATLP